MATIVESNVDVIQCADRAEWLTWRRKGIGGSDAPVVAGVSPWKGLMELFADKTGMTELSDIENEFLEWGLRLQPVIAQAYAEKTGRKIIDLGQFTIVRSRTLPWQIASLDYLDVDEHGEEGLLEIKNTSAYKLDEWEEEAPLAYQVQWQHQAGVTGKRRGAIATLIGGNHFRYVDMVRDDGFITNLTAAEARFWNLVETEQPPDVDGTDSTAQVIARLFPREEQGKVIALPHDAIQWDVDRSSVMAQIKELEARKKEIDARLKLAIGDAEKGILPGGGGFTFKEKGHDGYTVAPARWRELRRVAK